MKALSLWQPWAQLVALGFKEYETRSWKTDYRGPIAIHAAKHFSKEIQDLCSRTDRLARFHETLGLRYAELPRGAIVATAELKFCVRVEGLELSADERDFGDYSDGRWAWKFDNVRPLIIPRPAKGAQGLFDWIEDATGQSTLFS